MMICPTLNSRLLVLILALLPVSIHAQSKKDSLLNVLEKNGGSDSLYGHLIWQFVFNRPDSAILFGKKGLAWAEANNSNKFTATIYNRIGVAYDIKSMPDSALYWYNLALEESKKRGNRETEGGALNNIGLIYWNQGVTEKAIANYIASAEIFEEIGNLRGLAHTYNNIGLIEFEEVQLERSIVYHHKALSIRKQINDDYGIAASYSNLAQSYGIRSMNLDSAIYYLQLAIPIKEKLNDQYGLARSFNNLGDIYGIQGNLDEAEAFLQKALRIQLSLGNAEGYASTYYNIADVYRRRNDPKTQLVYLDSAQVEAEEHADLALVWKVYRTKARTLGKVGRYQEAHEYWVAYDNLKDSLVNAERSEKIQELETRYRMAEKDRELAEKKAVLAEKNLEIENRNKWIAGLGGLTLSLFVLGFAGFQVIKRRTQAEKDAAIIAERERGLKTMIEATEEERKRIAKDLHDGIVQSLTGLSLRLQKGFSFSQSIPEDEKREFDRSKIMLDDAIAELRTISHQMMPRVLSEMGLVPALEDMLNKSLGSTEIQYEFEHHRVESDRFADNVEVSLYRICQELVNNIIKHSEAKAVSVQLIKTKSHLVLVVEDNGKGFNFADKANQNGIGLMNISSRAKAINGEVNYEPSPNQGTVATIRIPLT